MGYDTISVEVIRNDEATHFLHKMCFYSGCIPDVWYKGIINPIPKSIYKLYCEILNNILSIWAEENKGNWWTLKMESEKTVVVQIICQH